MSESNPIHEPKPQDPELLLCQVHLKQLCDEILSLRPEDYQWSLWSVASSADPEITRARLRRSSIGGLLLRDGESLSAKSHTDRYPDLGLYVDKAELTGITVRAWGDDYEKHRIDPNGPDSPPFDVIYYPDELDWMRQLDIVLRYSNGQEEASETLSIQTYSRLAGELPNIVRQVRAESYAETGYEGHNTSSRPATNEAEIDDFIALARELIN